MRINEFTHIHLVREGKRLQNIHIKKTGKNISVPSKENNMVSFCWTLLSNTDWTEDGELLWEVLNAFYFCTIWETDHLLDAQRKRKNRYVLVMLEWHTRIRTNNIWVFFMCKVYSLCVFCAVKMNAISKEQNVKYIKLLLRYLIQLLHLQIHIF